MLWDSTKQFLVIMRYKTGAPPPAQDALKIIGAHWGAFIGELAPNGKLVTTYRSGTDGKMILRKAKTTREGHMGIRKS